ncbi:HAMP domain-containing sensor histidine kinase [Streptomyces sp. SH5]|uniref:sensor histidine kinase n=1 Tax=Streptomyces sp. SH5 TaxID=3041765 RepID=UPI002477DEF6|nr:HAMP domain-containing sensor histidine kinase [Streptomyces sp. SH5]WGP09677.1 HAMP domain-containing sensor histidine kinase [Streptomyces sp. SH5]
MTTTAHTAPHPLVPVLPLDDSPTIAAAAAHQVRGPLSSVRLRLELLQDRLTDGRDAGTAREVRGVLSEVDRLSDVLEQVLAWGSAARDTVTTEPVDVLGVTAARVDAWSATACTREVELRLTGVAVTGCQIKGALEQVLDILLDNALHVSPRGSEVLVTVRATSAHVQVELRDQGPGMTDEEISHACRPFWRGTSGRGRQGTGLGLTIASALLAASDGSLELGGSPAGGLRAVAVLPVQG